MKETARCGWLCAECYDQLEAAWDYILQRWDGLVVVDKRQPHRIDSVPG